MTHSCSNLDGMRLASSSSSSSISDSLQSGAKQGQPASKAVASTSGSALGESGADLESLFTSSRASRNSGGEDDDAHFRSLASSEKSLARGDSAAERDSFVARSLASGGDEGHHQQHQQVENVQLSTGSGSSVSFATDRISSCNHTSCYYTDDSMAGYGKLDRPFFEEEVEEVVEVVINVDCDYGQEEVVPVLVEARATASSRDINNRSPLHRAYTECAGAGTEQKENAHDSTHQLDNHQPVTKSVAWETDSKQLKIGGTDSARSVLSQRNVCDVCGKEFRWPSALTAHYRTHTGEKPYKCDICDAEFRQSNYLSRHYRTHTGEKPYKCEVCDAAFRQSCYLSRHYRTHTGEKPYKCEVCDAAFAQSNDLTAHNRTHTGEKPYKCDVCDAAFVDSGHLSRHNRTHTGEKPHKCDVCDAAFIESSKLSAHYRTHTGEKPYKCDLCGGAFTVSSSLSKHYRNIHS